MALYCVSTFGGPPRSEDTRAAIQATIDAVAAGASDQRVDHASIQTET